MSSQQVEQVKQRVDIVDLVQSYVKLEKSGINFRGRCPFHQERTPSFFVSPTRQTWRCFGCNKGGDHFTFIEEIEGVEFPDALKMLADRAGIKLVYEDPKVASERSRLYAISEEAAKFFERNLWGTDEHRATPMLQYLLRRGVAEKTIRSFRIGYAPDSWDALLNYLTRKGYRGDELEKAGLAIPKAQPAAGRGFYDRYRNRIIFPIADTSGKIIGFGGRIFPTASPQKEGEAKYINSPETPIYHKSHILYAFDKAKQAIREKNECILVEGYMDAIMAHQAGAMNTVAVSGTALTPDQLNILQRLTNKLIFCLDMDDAGRKATERSIELSLKELFIKYEYKFELKALKLIFGKDPADAIAENTDKFLAAVANSEPLGEYYLDEIKRRFDIKDSIGKGNAWNFFLEKFEIIRNPIELDHWLKKLAELIREDEKKLWELWNKRNVRKIQSFKNTTQENPFTNLHKIRRNLLEEELLTLYLENPSLFEGAIHVLPEPIPFSVLAHEQLFNELKEHTTPVSDELSALYDSLQFRREMIQRAPEKLPEAITSCVNGIMREFYKEKQAALHAKIKHLEKSENKDRMKHLLADFHAVSAKIQKYSV